MALFNEKNKPKQEPVAIIGMSCRFPGGANTPELLWDLLASEKDILREIPAERWNIDEYYDEDRDALGKMYVRKAYFLDEVDQFDPLFFNLSPKKVTCLDPQQRLLLEVAWEALESANIVPASLEGSQTGIFLSTFWDDYSSQRMYSEAPEDINRHTALSSLRAMAPGRLAELLGVHGPNIILDSACSASLAAIHMACRSLADEECDLALVGGAYLLLSPEILIGLSRMKTISADGYCKIFSESADGLSLGEGCGMVLLKRLSEAQADGDEILAVIRGSAMNHNGNTRIIAKPNGSAEEALFQRTLKQAAIRPEQIQYIEAGTAALASSDAIEASAVAKVYCQTPRDKPLAMGSLKTNIGHLNAAAGVAGLIKTVLAIRHKKIPATLHHSQPNKNIDFKELGLVVPTKMTPWISDGVPRIAGVSAFALNGSNAHLILEEAPKQGVADVKMKRDLSGLLTLSAKSLKALQAQAKNYIDYLSSLAEEYTFSTVCRAVAMDRQHFVHRLAITASSCEEAITLLLPYVENTIPRGINRKNSAKFVFMFTGESEQYTNMARELYDTEAVFRKTFNHYAGLLTDYLDQPLVKIFNDFELVDQAYAQPAHFIFEYSLATLWKSWGVHPSFLLANYRGELTAACLAGVFSVEDGIKLTVARAKFFRGTEQPELGVNAFHEIATSICYKKPTHDLISTATGELFNKDVCTPNYWLNQREEKACLADKTMSLLLEKGADIFLEIGPKSVLLERVEKRLGEAKGIFALPSFHDNQLLTSLGELYIQGVDIDWQSVYKNDQRKKINLPTYPFQRSRYWVDLKMNNSANIECVQNVIIEKKNDAILQRLVSVKANQQKELLLEYVHSIVVTILELPGDTQIDEQQSFFTLGMDSLTSIALVTQLEKNLKITLSVMTVFDNPSIESISEYLIDNLLGKELTEKDQNLLALNVSADLVPVARNNSLALSFGQERMHQTLSSTSMISPWILRFEGELNVIALEQSFQAMIQRHEILRTTFPLVDGAPVQRVSAAVGVDIQHSNFSRLLAPEQLLAIKKICHTEMLEFQFDLSTGPLFRVNLMKLSEESHLLLLCQHHIITDLSSWEIFTEELFDFYSSFVVDKPSRLEKLPVQYVDYVAWNRRFFQNPQVLQARRDYWKQWFSEGVPSALALPTDRPRVNQTFCTSTLAYRLSDDLSQGLMTLTQQQGITPFITLLTSLSILLCRYGCCDDVIVGATFSNRNHEKLKSLMGYIGSLLLIRASLKENPKLLTLLSQVRETVQAAIANQDIPFLNVFDKTDNDYVAPAFKVMFTYIPDGVSDKWQAEKLAISRVKEDYIKLENRPDVVLILWREKNKKNDLPVYKGFWRYRDDLFDEKRMQEMSETFTTLLKSMMSDTAQSVLDLKATMKLSQSS